MYNYGQCHICGKPMRERRINQDFWIKRKLIVIENIPAGVCPQCGEKVINAEVGEGIASLLQGSTQLRVSRKMTVPVIQFIKESA